jgi:nitrous oxidase accessory protein NosD
MILVHPASAFLSSLKHHLIIVLLLLVMSGFLVRTGLQARAAQTTLAVPSVAYPTIQSAIDAASSGEIISIAPGTYTEQLVISKSLTITGAGGGKTIIKAPPTLSLVSGTTAANPRRAIVVVNGGASVAVAMSNLEIKGPGNSSCESLTYGLLVIGGATLSLKDSEVHDIGDQPLGSCENGIAIGAGLYLLDQTGNIHLDNVAIWNYQRAGIALIRAGSTGHIENCIIDGTNSTQDPESPTKRDGIQITDGARASIIACSISGNKNEVDAGAVSDLETPYFRTGILIACGSPGTVIEDNYIGENSIGISQSAPDTRIHNNLILNNTEEGVRLYEGRAILMQNTICGNRIGTHLLSLEQKSGPGLIPDDARGDLLSNYITQNQVGIKLTDRATGDEYQPQLFTCGNRIVANSEFGLQNLTPQSVDVTNNFWGCNAGPGNPGCDVIANQIPDSGKRLEEEEARAANSDEGIVTFDPWLQLTLSVTPERLMPGGKAAVTATFVSSSNLETACALPKLPVETPVIIEWDQKNTVPLDDDGQAKTEYPANTPGIFTISTTVDNATVTKQIQVSAQPSGVMEIAPGTLSVIEGGAATFTVRRTGGTAAGESISYTIAPGTATAGTGAGADYSAPAYSGTIIFSEGETEKVITVQTTDDALDEPDETFTVTLSNPGGGAKPGAVMASTATILDNDNAPTISVASLASLEGNSNTAAERKRLTFNATLSAASGKTVTLQYATVDGTARAGTDFSAMSGALTFAPGETSKTITVEILGDLILEGDENFTLEVRDADLLLASATGTIQNDDAEPAMTINNASVIEGNSGVTIAELTVTLSNPVGYDFTFNCETSDDTAKSDSDYFAAQEVISVPAGQTSVKITVRIKTDTIVEPDETFLVKIQTPFTAVSSLGKAATGLLSARAALNTLTGRVTILNDDVASTIQFAAEGLIVNETAGTATVRLVRTGNASGSVNVVYRISDGTAIRPADYDALATGTVTFADGETEKTITIRIIDDSLIEASELLRVEIISADGNATLGTITRSLVEITDDDSLTTIGPGTVPDAINQVSGTHAGSILVFPLYTSSSANSLAENTLINLTNTHPTESVVVHLFFVDGAACGVRDRTVCLTRSQTMRFNTADVDPDTTGYLIAVAINKDTGCPVKFNYLTGDSYVKFQSGHQANLNAWSFSALMDNPSFCRPTENLAEIAFDGVHYNAAPRVLALSNFNVNSDALPILVINRLGGNLTEAADPVGNIFGLVYDDTEKQVSFMASGGCQIRRRLDNSFPLTAPRLQQFVARTGWMKFWTSGTEKGMVGAVLQRNSRNGAVQGHNLHTLTTTSQEKLTIPVFPPDCR